MRTISFGFVAGFTLLMSSASAFAQSGPWTISESSGPVQINDTSGQRAAQRGSVVPMGATIATGAAGKAVMVRGREFVTLKPNSRIRIPAASETRSVVQILQDWGQAVFSIGKQANPHFAVKTPYLAAVVKGTTFEVSVDDRGASVEVTEGAVEVSTNDGETREMALAGDIASVKAGDGSRLTVQVSAEKAGGKTAQASPSKSAAPVGPDAASANGPSGVIEGDAANEAKDKAEASADDARDAAEEAKDKAEGAADEAKGAAEDATNKAEDADEASADAADEAKDAAAGAVEDADDAAEEAKDKAADAVDDAAEEAQDKAADAADDAAEEAQDKAADAADDAAEDAQDKAADAADDAVEEAQDTAADAAEDAAEDAQDKAADAVDDAAEDAAQDAVDAAVDDAIDDAIDEAIDEAIDDLTDDGVGDDG